MFSVPFEGFGQGRELLDEPLFGSAVMGSFDCGFAALIAKQIPRSG
jgi:hypothetical protein